MAERRHAAGDQVDLPRRTDLSTHRHYQRGGWNHYETEAAMLRMANAGAQLVTTFALACELQADWKSSTANDMLAPFNHNLSEYGFVLQNFWNNAGQHTVPDPFGMVR